MEQQVEEHIGAGRHERSEDRTGYRNGYKPRSLGTRVGKLKLSVPQVRNCEPYEPRFWNKWQRNERALLVACAEMYFQGVSTRSVQEVLETMCDGEISSMTVSRVAQELDQKLLEFRTRKVDHYEWPYLQIDARYEKVRVEGKVISQAVLVVLGVNNLGRREVLDWRIGDSESEGTWGEMFQGLKDRGIKGVKLVVSDAHSGIRAALRRHFQGSAWQRCIVHFKRELMHKVGYKARNELLADIKSVLMPQERMECMKRGEEMAAKWEGRYPAVARMLREGLEDCLAVFGEPEEVRMKLSSTNLPESMMKVLRKRTAVVGVFPNRASCDRLIGALLIEQHEKWLASGHPYMNLEQYRG
jgi:transposase-like protein